MNVRKSNFEWARLKFFLNRNLEQIKTPPTYQNFTETSIIS